MRDQRYSPLRKTSQQDWDYNHRSLFFWSVAEHDDYNPNLAGTFPSSSFLSSIGPLSWFIFDRRESKDNYQEKGITD